MGKVKIDGVDYFGDALFTIDGKSHLYVGGPYADDGTVQRATPWGSVDFVGFVDGQQGPMAGTGRVIGRHVEDCGNPGSPSARFCTRTMSAGIRFARVVGSESGAIHGEIAVDNETWVLDLTPWSNQYSLPARLEDLGGLYVEELAMFARSGDMLVSIDDAGRLFFQAALYHCAGNGTLAPHGDGKFNVFEVTMTIDNCEYPYSSLNGSYQGLATLSAGSYWDYDSNLRIWLSRGSPSSAAVAMWGRRQ